jgi:protein-tyrosine phosphatase
LDDGAHDLEESIEIARQFSREGVDRIAATPHVDAMRGTGPPRADIQLHVTRLCDTLTAAGIGLDVVAGCELYLTPDAPAWLRSGRATPLGGSNAVLVECSFNDRPLYLEDTLFQLQLAGYRPILAHPERYAFVQRDLSLVDDLVRREVSLQLTAPSLLGEYGARVRRVAERLLQSGAYALAASDRHHPGSDRSLAALHERLMRLTDHDVADLLLRGNPAAVLEGKPLVQPDPPVAPRESYLGRFWRRR